MLIMLLRLFIPTALIDWLKPSVSDNKGEASSRRISALYLMVLYGIGHLSYIWILHTSDDSIKVELAEYLVWFMVVDIVGALLYIGLVTVQNIQFGLEALRGQRHTKEEKPEKPTETPVI